MFFVDLTSSWSYIYILLRTWSPVLNWSASIYQVIIGHKASNDYQMNDYSHMYDNG